MATVGKTITNSKTGQSYHFLQTAKSTDGSVLEMESVYDADSKQPPMHRRCFLYCLLLLHTWQDTDRFIKNISIDVETSLG